jgi:hypothetical protein
VRHDSLRPAVPKDPRASRASSSATPAAAPSRTTRSGGAPSAPAPNSGILKMLWGIFATCQCTDQRLDVMDQLLQIVWRNQEIISQPTGRAAPGVPRRLYLPARPRPLWLADSCRVACFRHWTCSCFFER